MNAVAVLYETVHGSRAYGLAGPSSDLDRRGVFVGTRVDVLGYRPSPEQQEPEPERVLYEIRKFFRLAVQCNPTVIEVLFTDPSDHVTVTPLGQRLLDLRERFLSRRAGESFGRYGLAQLKRIRTHRRWLLSPPLAKPERSAFGLAERPTVSPDEIGAAEAVMARGGGADDFTPRFMDMLDRERRYRRAMQEWQQHQDWQRQRNPARAALEAEFGYDTKHAMHLVRLMRMGREILETGHVHVRRADAEELRAIRRGALRFDALMAEAERLEADLEAAGTRSVLPEAPDETFLNEGCAAIVEEALRAS